jgi:hypothetical protein
MRPSLASVAILFSAYYYGTIQQELLDKKSRKKKHEK